MWCETVYRPALHDSFKKQTVGKELQRVVRAASMSSDDTATSDTSTLDPTLTAVCFCAYTFKC